MKFSDLCWSSSFLFLPIPAGQYHVELGQLELKQECKSQSNNVLVQKDNNRNVHTDRPVDSMSVYLNLI